MRVVLSGGGTGGHVYPALAVAEALTAAADEGSPPELLYIGVTGRMDEAIVGRAGLRFDAVPAGPLRVGSVFGFVRGAANVLAGTAQAWRLLGRFRPQAVFATGGYASVPVGLAARFRQTPLVVYLPDVRPGWAVRLLSKLAMRIGTSTERAERELPRGKTVVVGYPVREAFWRTDRAEARRTLGLPVDALVLLVTGASQGARRINDAVAAQLDALLEICHVLHLTGRADEERMLARRGALPEELRERYHVAGYLDDMPAAMAAADLAVMRAGGSILGELPAAGLAAILVPGVYEGWDQTPNARYLEERGAAVVLENDRLDRLAEVARDLLVDDARRRELSEAVSRLTRPNAANDLAQMIREVARAA